MLLSDALGPGGFLRRDRQNGKSLGRSREPLADSFCGHIAQYT
jgi:hypothetical protein